MTLPPWTDLAAMAELPEGDVVGRVVDGLEIARGLANYGASEARLIARRPSAQIAEVLGYVNELELIHRTNLVRL